MIDSQSNDTNDKVLGSEDKVNKEVTTNPTVNEAVVVADRAQYWYLSDEQFQERASKAYKVIPLRAIAWSILNEMSDSSKEYWECKKLLKESSGTEDTAPGIRIRTPEELKKMTPRMKRVYYACRDAEEYALFNPNCEDLPDHVRALVLKKVESDNWARYFIPTKEQVNAIDGIILNNVQPVDIINKARRYPQLRETLEAHERENSTRTSSSKTDGVQTVIPSCMGVRLDKVYFGFPISLVRKRVYQVCFEPEYNMKDELKLDRDALLRLDRLILSRIQCTDLQSKVPVKYDLLVEANMGTPYCVGLDNEFVLKLLLLRGMVKQWNTAFTTTIKPMFGGKYQLRPLINTADKDETEPRLCNSIACLPLYARYHALEHVYRMPMLEVYFPMGDLQLLARAAKCQELLTAMSWGRNRGTNTEEVSQTDAMKALFDGARALYLGKTLTQEQFRELVAAAIRSAYEERADGAEKELTSEMRDGLKLMAGKALMSAEDEANRLYEACKKVKLYDCHDFVRVIKETCRKNQTWIYAHDRVYVPKEADEQALTAFKMMLNDQGFIWALKGRDGSLTSGFNVDYEYFDTNRGMEEQEPEKEVVGELVEPPSSGHESWLKAMLAA